MQLSQIFTAPLSHWVRDQFLWLDPITGEAIADNLVDTEKDQHAYIRTGFYFERAWQHLPAGVDIETGRQWVDIPDWAFATAETAEGVAQMLRDAMQELNYAIVRVGANNPRAPYSRLPLVVHLSSSAGGQLMVNAGLIAFYVARHCSYDPTSGKIRRNYTTALGPIVESLRLELSGSAADNNRLVASLAGLEGAPNKFQVVASR